MQCWWELGGGVEGEVIDAMGWGRVGCREVWTRYDGVGWPEVWLTVYR